ncbi:hypothetical protein BZG36_02766 [Bifiguratus adelaidae]|uniref:Uncharacterized protein n=1 Tax=Bifiguratus adelaidae TaxID=1938954 RepID=A0A261Y270_9FUNG|nr:hypothetical protein BZG36_02766 [Bifiguratus adelaidae]
MKSWVRAFTTRVPRYTYYDLVAEQPKHLPATTGIISNSDLQTKQEALPQPIEPSDHELLLRLGVTYGVLVPDRTVPPASDALVAPIGKSPPLVCPLHTLLSLPRTPSVYDMYEEALTDYREAKQAIKQRMSSLGVPIPPVVADAESTVPKDMNPGLKAFLELEKRLKQS